MTRLRRAMVVCVALIAGVTGMMVVTPGTAGADPLGWDTHCQGKIITGFPTPEPAIEFDVGAPPEVDASEGFTVTFATELSFPNSINTIIAPDVAVLSRSDIEVMIDVPLNASVDGVSFVPDTGFGITGEPTVSIDDSYVPARIVMHAAEVLAGDGPTTSFSFPTLEVELTATGPSGAEVTFVPSGVVGYGDAGYRFAQLTELLPQPGEARCWSVTSAPVLAQTEISGGSESAATAIEITSVPHFPKSGVAGTYGVFVTANAGAVELVADDHVVGSGPVGPSGATAVQATFPAAGTFELTARYVPTAPYLTSVSAPVEVQVQQGEDPFSDVPEGHEFFTEIMWAHQEGITQGYGDGTFRPSSAVTREAVAAFLYRMSGAPLGASPVCEEMAFDDVPVDHPFCGEIAWMADQGITTGYEDGSFDPAGVVTRQAIAAFIQRAVVEGPAASCTEAPFTDVPVSHAFCAEIAWLTEEGIAAGYGDGSFLPMEPVTRQAAAAFLYRADAA
jgi:hypothetical protein